MTPIAIIRALAGLLIALTPWVAWMMSRPTEAAPFFLLAGFQLAQSGIGQGWRQAMRGSGRPRLILGVVLLLTLTAYAPSPLSLCVSAFVLGIAFYGVWLLGMDGDPVELASTLAASLLSGALAVWVPEMYPWATLACAGTGLLAIVQTGALRPPPVHWRAGFGVVAS